MRDPFEGAALPAASKQEQPPDALPVSRLDARQIPLAHRFDAWHEGCAPLFDTTCLGDPGRFDVGAICYLVDRLMFTRVHFERMHFSRGTPQLSSGESDCITVQHYRRGSVTGRLDDGTPLCMAPDRISIHDYAHAYTGVGESMPRRIWPTLLCGFTGVALVLHPNLTALNTGYLFGLAAGILFAVQIMLTRRLNQLHEPQDRILLYIYLIGIVGTIIPAAQTYVRPDFVTVERLTFAGLFLLGSTTFIVKAMGHAPAWLLAPLGYSAVVFSALLDWLVLDKLPGMVSSAGIMLVIVSGISTMRFAPHQGHGETAMIAKEGCT